MMSGYKARLGDTPSLGNDAATFLRVRIYLQQNYQKQIPQAEDASRRSR
jgi:hypothetical protein